ncbi:hypothetical protein CWC48_09740 [Pseudomonas sp. S10E 269]|nr:hypothetical protein CWC48_09740 [Pseudomonas sp. S10E 269]
MAFIHAYPARFKKMKYSPIIDYFRLIKAFMNIHDPMGFTRHSFKTDTCTMPEKLPLITINKEWK